MFNLDLTKFSDKGEVFKYIVDNEDLIISLKKSSIKKADGFSSGIILNDTLLKLGADKDQNGEPLLNKNVLDSRLCINTTKIFDSHFDVHLDGIWDKRINDFDYKMHLDSHKREFDRIISDGKDLKSFVDKVDWKDLGYNLEGKTQALTFLSKIKKSRNPYMHKQYAEGRVRNHSVGMRYEKIITCVNDESYPAYKDNWDSLIDLVVNREEAEKAGFFWGIKEASFIEGSAVLLGSNRFTPTVSVKQEINSREKSILKWLNS